MSISLLNEVLESFQNSESTHVGIIGDVRSGKTLLMVNFALFSSRNRLVKTNLKRLDHENYEHVTISDFLDFDKFDNCDVYIDEIYTWLESRFSFDEVNLALSHFGFQSGKRNVNIIWTAQFMMSVDIRYRFLAKVLFSCAHDKENHVFRYKRYIRTMIGEPPYQEPHYQYIDDFYITENDAKKYLYDKYDTFEIIQARKKRKMRWALLAEDDEAYDNALLELTVKIAKLIGEDGKVTREKVRIQLNKLKEPLYLESEVYYPLLDDFYYFYQYES